MGIRIYRLTHAGARALEDRGAIPVWYRALLDLVRDGRAFPSDSPRQMLAWLDELETLGFLDPDSFAQDLDVAA
jgi:hypothetical protein